MIISQKNVHSIFFVEKTRPFIFVLFHYLVESYNLFSSNSRSVSIDESMTEFEK
jgi:hypothetical protein